MTIAMNRTVKQLRPKRGVLNREGAYSKSHICVDEIDHNFLDVTVTAITITEQETGLSSPFYKCIVLTFLEISFKFQ